jgi:hypothetical protein
LAAIALDGRFQKTMIRGAARFFPTSDSVSHAPDMCRLRAWHLLLAPAAPTALTPCHAPPYHRSICGSPSPIS